MTYHRRRAAFVILAAATLGWSGGASAQKPKPATGGVVTPATDADRILTRMVNSAGDAENSARAAAERCDTLALNLALGDLKLLQREIGRIAAAAQAAGSLSSFKAASIENTRNLIDATVARVSALRLKNCSPSERRPEPKATTGDLGPGSTYRPAQATPEMKELYRHDIEALFGDVEKARAKGDCAAWDAAIARLTALLNDYRAMVRGEADPATRVIWADRLARAKSQRPNCAEPAPAFIEKGNQPLPAQEPVPETKPKRPTPDGKPKPSKTERG